MTLRDYPYIESRDTQGIISTLERIVDIRQDDISQLNEQLRSEGYDKGFRRTTASKSSAYSAGENDYVIDVNANSGAVTITLLANPVDGQEHTVIKNDASGNAVTIDANGGTINGSSTISITTQYQGRRLIYIGDAEWRALTL